MKAQIIATLTAVSVLSSSISAASAQGAAAITQIRVRVVTSTRPAAGTDDPVYLGLGGREFKLEDGDPAFDDYADGSDHSYIFGVGSNVARATLNDPRDPPRTTDDLQAFPVYIRKSSDTAGATVANWDVEEVMVTVNPGLSQSIYSALEGPEHLWLGNGSGLVLYLKRRR
ncbi:MAG: hypothetical protein HY650_06265 [Acidobacteria bacterium]|nr:hypothetical protein [Acidobacteriota bacterium]